MGCVLTDPIPVPIVVLAVDDTRKPKDRTRRDVLVFDAAEFEVIRAAFRRSPEAA